MAITDRTRRLLWFAGLWLAGVAAVSALAYGLRFVMRLAGIA